LICAIAFKVASWHAANPCSTVSSRPTLPLNNKSCRHARATADVYSMLPVRTHGSYDATPAGAAAVPAQFGKPLLGRRHRLVSAVPAQYGGSARAGNMPWLHRPPRPNPRPWM